MKNNLILFLLFATGIATAMTQSSNGSPTSNGSPVKTMIIKEDYKDYDTIELERPEVVPGPQEKEILEEQEARLLEHMEKWEQERKRDLAKAIWKGQTETVKQLLKAGPLPEYEEKPLLFLATRYPKIVQLLLEANANPNSFHPRTGDTPLIDAVKRGYIDTVRILLEKNADPNKTDKKENRTALTWATKRLLGAKTQQRQALYGNIIDLLLPYGAK